MGTIWAGGPHSVSYSAFSPKEDPSKEAEPEPELEAEPEVRRTGQGGGLQGRGRVLRAVRPSVEP